MCVLIFSTTFVWSIFHSKKNWARCDQKMCVGLHVKCRLLLSDFNGTLIFLGRFSKNTQISNSIKIRQIGAELFRADWQTGMTKLIVALRNIANARKNSVPSSVKHRLSWLVLLNFRLSVKCRVCKCSEAGRTRSMWPLLWRMRSFTWIVRELIGCTVNEPSAGVVKKF
jgi:hypothetical protein